MAETVKTARPDDPAPGRPYDSSRRRAQAAATRADILDAAQRLFDARGYGATTMEAIATEAGVALKTVYVAFDTKSGLLRALWNHLLREGRDEVPVADQEWYRAIVEEPDPDRQLRLAVQASRIVKLRIAGVIETIRTAAALEPDIAGLWARIQSDFHANQRVIVESLAQKGALKPGLDVERATDILWTVNHPNLWQLLVEERAWTPEEYEEWCAEVARAQLLA
jgi:AcrR family transcriptional regulator